jgi:hypothetical protein
METTTTPQTETQTETRKLSFTVVNGNAVLPNLKWSSFELHATGCKDLNGLIRKQTTDGLMPKELPGGFWVEEASTPAEAVEQALGSPEDGGPRSLGYLPKDFRICSCCSLKRMVAAGRA